MKPEVETKDDAKVAKAAADPRKVELLDAAGQSIGVTVTLKDEPAPAEEPGPDETLEAMHIRRLSKSVTSWTHLEVDGEPYPFSQARAASLLTRYPHFADQIGKALKL
ncbi:hypothetical protein [Aureimonas sp. N4]|uniref:hypothetical protein n=1 Tax=Aureimonas sp. N4 TaxID=1638165 RepID=UPI0007831783|nr:hypothetical protein [Aureimonas sp. N4]